MKIQVDSEVETPVESAGRRARAPALLFLTCMYWWYSDRNKNLFCFSQAPMRPVLEYISVSLAAVNVSHDFLFKLQNQCCYVFLAHTRTRR